MDEQLHLWTIKQHKYTFNLAQWLIINTPIENQLYGMTINCVLETYNNTICIETHNQLHLHTIVYSKWSIINVN